MNEQRGHDFFVPMDSMMNTLPEQPLLIWDVSSKWANSGLITSAYTVCRLRLGACGNDSQRRRDDYDRPEQEGDDEDK